MTNNGQIEDLEQFRKQCAMPADWREVPGVGSLLIRMTSALDAQPAMMRIGRMLDKNGRDFKQWHPEEYETFLEIVIDFIAASILNADGTKMFHLTGMDVLRGMDGERLLAMFTAVQEYNAPPRLPADQDGTVGIELPSVAVTDVAEPVKN